MVWLMAGPMPGNETDTPKESEESARGQADRTGNLEQSLVQKDRMIADLQRQLEICRRQVAEQREIIRKHSLNETVRSIDESSRSFPTSSPTGVGARQTPFSKIAGFSRSMASAFMAGISRTTAPGP